ncbi:MAG TPA: hypothetical protein PKX93_09045 [bacterium]|nr:hypothetical protein [bacterium]HOL67586.1 hypothetical protein [bacterium]HPP13129.1 hypothetical protein [bacterium]
MIRIELDLAVALYLCLGFLVLFFWLLLEARRKGEGYSGQENLWQCPVCFFWYIDSLSETLSRCPRCGTLHRKGEEGVKYIEETPKTTEGSVPSEQEG